MLLHRRRLGNLTRGWPPLDLRVLADRNQLLRGAAGRPRLWPLYSPPMLHWTQAALLQFNPPNSILTANVTGALTTSFSSPHYSPPSPPKPTPPHPSTCSAGSKLLQLNQTMDLASLKFSWSKVLFFNKIPISERDPCHPPLNCFYSLLHCSSSNQLSVTSSKWSAGN